MKITDVRYIPTKKNPKYQESTFDLHEKLILKNAQMLLDAGFLLSKKDLFSFHLDENGEDDLIFLTLKSRQFAFYSNKIEVLYYFTNIY